MTLCTNQLFCRPVTTILATKTGFQVRQQHAMTSAFVFHPTKQTLEADVQMFLWTKAQQVEQPPSIFSRVREDVDLEFFQTIVERHIMISRYYEKEERKIKSKRKANDFTRGAHKNFPYSLIQNIIKTTLIRADKYPQVRQLNVAMDAPVSTTWKCKDVAMTVRGRPGLWLNSSQPLPQFFEDSLVEGSKSYSFEDVSPNPLHYNLHQYSVKESHGPGFVGTLDKVAFPYLHTLIVMDNGEYSPPPSKGVPEIQLLQKGLIYTFGRLLTQAVLKHGNEILGQVLPEPECAQCIATDGQRFSFLWFQLNTLDLSDLNSGVKNLVCVERPGQLFSSIEDLTRQRKTVKDLNDDILRTIIGQLLLSRPCH